MTEKCKEQLRLTFSTLDPVHLLNQIREAQRELVQQETSNRIEQPVETGQDLSRFVESLSTAWRTRADPFESVWPLVEQWLNQQPGATAKELFQRLQTQMPESFKSAQLRTLQRRVKEWRAAVARRLVLGSTDAATIDSAETTKEEVTS